MSDSPRTTILLVEDRRSDILLATRALKKAGYDVDVKIVMDGQSAVDFLQNEEEAKPNLVILDWMLPLLDGREVLERIRKNPRTRRLPVVVLTTSTDEKDVNTAYDNGCNAYLQKPVRAKDFNKAMEALGLFWLKNAVLPS